MPFDVFGEREKWGLKIMNDCNAFVEIEIFITQRAKISNYQLFVSVNTHIAK